MQPENTAKFSVCNSMVDFNTQKSSRSFQQIVHVIFVQYHIQKRDDRQLSFTCIEVPEIVDSVTIETDSRLP